MEEEKKEKQEKKKYDSGLVTKESISAVGAVFSLLALLVLFTRSVLFGEAGLQIHMLLTGALGYAAYPFFIWLAYLSVTGFFDVSLFKNKKVAVTFGVAFVLCLFAVQTALALADGSIHAETYLVDCFNAGETFPKLAVAGWVGALPVYGLSKLTTPVGALIIFAALTLIAVYVAAAFSGKATFRKKEKAEKTEEKKVPERRIEEPERAQPTQTEAAATTQVEPLPGYQGGYDPSSMGGYYPYSAQVSQRPGVMLSSDGTPATQGGFSPFAPTQPRETERSFSYEESREFLFGASPAEIYKKNLIFDSNANVNKRPPVDPTQPAFLGTPTTYSSSYAQSVDRAAERSERTSYPNPFGDGREEFSGFGRAAQAPVEPTVSRDFSSETQVRGFGGVEETPARGVEQTARRVDDFGFGGGREEGYSPYELRTEDLGQTSRVQETKAEERDAYRLDDTYTVRDLSAPTETAASDGRRDSSLSLEDMEGDGKRHDYMGLFSLSNPRVFGAGEEKADELPRDRSTIFDDPIDKADDDIFSASRRVPEESKPAETTDFLAGRRIPEESKPTETTDFLAGRRVPEESKPAETTDFLAGRRIPEESEPVKEEKPIPKKEEEKPAPPKPRVYKPYVRIPLDYFDCTDAEPETNEVEVEHIKRMILGTLADFKVTEASIASVTFGPAVTRYNVVLPRGTSPKKVVALEQEIAIALCSGGVNIYPSFEDGAVSIEVPNKTRQDVSLGCMLSGEGFTKAKPTSLTFAMGKDVANRKVYGDICKMTHLLVAGASGSGKSAFLASLLVSLIVKYSPEELRLILIDPKKTEFVLYNGLPHLMINEIITEPSKAVQSLNWAIGEMNRRYALFAKMSLSGTYVVNLDEYNANVKKEEKLPKIVIVVDELADLMLAAKKDIEDKIQNLTQKARAAGIHLVIATQRPSVDVITGVIKGNLSTRIAFTVASDQDSRVILDQGGAHKLLGRGDMLYTTSGINVPVRVQGAFIAPSEAQKVVNFIKANNEAFYDEAATAFINNKRGGDGGEGGMNDAVDEAYISALKVAIQNGNASISMLQRKCSIGFNKAGKIIEWMEMMEYISPFEGAAKPRKILITKEEFERLYGEF